MFDITSGPGDAGHGSFGSPDNSNGYRHGRGRLRGDDFGLTARPSLLGLARTYLETQARLWPELAGTPAVPTITDAAVEAMADDFERRFRTQLVDVFNPAGLRRVWTDIGLGYVRFSDEGSNPRSLDQQLINVLQRARRDGVFIPWHYVCADYAVSGTLACRRGYIVAKMLVERRAETGVAWFIIDDLGRMNRNALESLRLGELVEATQVRLIGASDGFDSSNQQSKIMLAMMSSFNEVFIDQLKAKVHRGQTDAFKRGEIVQHPGFGYRLVDVLTPEGKPELTRKGTIKKRVEIDPEAAEWIVRGAEMIVRDSQSPGAVAVVFNDNNVGGARTWSSNRIRKLYARERLVGVEVFRKTKQVRDRDTGHVDVVQKDREEWMTRECPEMRILSDELAEAVKAKLNLGSMRFGKNAAELRRDGKDPGRRVDVYPTVLVRPVCGGCGKPMALSRSTGKYKSFVCLNSIHGGHGCRDVVVLLNRTPKYAVMLPQIVEMAEAGSGIDLISRALGIGAEVVRDALYLHRTGKRPPGRIDGRRRRPHKPGQPFVPRYKQIAAEVDRRRKAGEGFDRLAREMKVSRGTVLRAYDFANRDEAAAAAREGRKPTRPPYKWSNESRSAKRKSRGA